jgi:glutamyl-tRNA synthetase
VLGRFAPSPTGPLHLGNLRTALVAWCAASDVVVRIEDLDRATASTDHARRQLADLAALGMRTDHPVVVQSERFELHRAAIADLEARGLVYRCYCTRREIRDAVAAPNGVVADGAYPGTCRDLSDAEHRRRARDGRRPALRLRSDGATISFDDAIAGRCEGVVDDVVVQRNDGIPAYNLAVVVDDHLQGVELVVRGDDLVPSTPRQIALQRLLGFATPRHAHVPLVVGPDGQRLAKRHGAVTRADRLAAGDTDRSLLATLGASLGFPSLDTATSARSVTSAVGRDPAGDLRDVVATWRETFSFGTIPREPWSAPVRDATMDR